MPTDTTERGLERLICTALTGHPCDPPPGAAGEVSSGFGGGAPDGSAEYSTTRTSASYGGVGWTAGNSRDYNREYCLDLSQLAAFLRATQPEAAESLALDEDNPTRRKFLARLRDEIAKRGTIDVLRHGVKHGAHRLDLFYGTPSAGNEQAGALFERNRFTVTRQLRYSREEIRRALDIGLFVNGLPVFTFELKNSLTKQTVDDAVRQYREDRDPREKLFAFGRCVAHFAVDESEVRFCTHLKGKASWFLPFNKGWNDGAGNPPNPGGLKTDYLWREVLTRRNLTDILENYAQVVEEKDEKTGRKKRNQIWPRYHQLDVVRKLLADAGEHGAGRRYLIQHSAGSGKSNSIAWLAHRLIGLRKDDATVFDSIIVVTDRRILDRQIRDTIRQYAQVKATVGHAERSGDLRGFIEDGKKIIISTVQKFPFILDEIGDRQRGRRFAIIIDEAHSSQGGRTSAAMSRALSGASSADGAEAGGADNTEKDDTGGAEASGTGGAETDGADGAEADNIGDTEASGTDNTETDNIGDAEAGGTDNAEADGTGDAEASGTDNTETDDTGEDETFEDRINRLMESRKLLPNASYFAFTATPKNRTLEIFGQPDPQPDGAVKHHAFHGYTMKQAIQEGFILDVLAHYTPVRSYYRLAKTVEDDPEFDVNRAHKKLRRFVEGHEHAIRLKAEIMVDHFHEQVADRRKIGGEARAMVVTNGIERAIQYYHAIRDYLKERKSPFEALAAFSGEHEYGGARVSEASLNGFPSGRIAERFREDPYRFLICADKFQTGYDEPLLHTMYVDKTLSGIKAVQTLSRLNRAHPKKDDTFVLDFLNEADAIRDAFAPFYRATILADETDPDKLHDLQADLDGAQVYSDAQIDDLVRRYLDGAERDRLDPILDACVAVYMNDLDEDRQVDFKGKAKGFVRTYAFLSSVLPYTNAEWEKRSILLNFLVPRLPAPREEDLSRGILDAIDMDSYRVEKRAVQQLLLPDEDAEIDPVPTGAGGHRPETELDRLSNILRQFNDLFGDVPWRDADRVRQLITETIPARVAEDAAYKNAQRNSDRQNARIEHDKALLRVMTALMQDDTELFKQYMDNDGFKRWMTDAVFELTYSVAGP